MKRAALAVLPLAALLAACSPSAPTPVPTVTVYADPLPAPTVTVYVDTADPVEDIPAADGYVFEALGTGAATVTYVSDGAASQVEVTLPHEVSLTPGTLGLRGVVNGQDVGCKIRQGDVVLDETAPAPGQFYAECVYDQ